MGRISARSSHHIRLLQDVSDETAAMQQLLTCCVPVNSKQLRGDAAGGGDGGPVRFMPRTTKWMSIRLCNTTCRRSSRSSVANCPGNGTTSPCRTSRHGRGPPACGCWRIFGAALLLSTSNRSEAAVGYATMDGDTCGGLAPIAGIDKAFLRIWLRWMETEGPVESGPQPQLACVNHQQPTAELRPPSEHQTDEADLMPYPILDAVERAGIRDKSPPWECLERLGQDFPQYSLAQRATWVERFFRLWCRNQWKRERYAPSFHWTTRISIRRRGVAFRSSPVVTNASYGKCTSGADCDRAAPNATRFAEPDISRHALACGSLGKTDEPRAIALRLIRDLWQSERHWAQAVR